jgi:hypothetical protein
MEIKLIRPFLVRKFVMLGLLGLCSLSLEIFAAPLTLDWVTTNFGIRRGEPDPFNDRWVKEFRAQIVLGDDRLLTEGTFFERRGEYGEFLGDNPPRLINLVLPVGGFRYRTDCTTIRRGLDGCAAYTLTFERSLNLGSEAFLGQLDYNNITSTQITFGTLSAFFPFAGGLSVASDQLVTAFYYEGFDGYWKVAKVPNPSTFVLMLLPFLGLMGMRFRK